MAKNYIAKISGKDERYGLKRDFLGVEVPAGRNFAAMRNVGVSELFSSLSFDEGVYEVGEGYNNKYKTLILYKGGETSVLSKNEVLAHL